MRKYFVFFFVCFFLSVSNIFAQSKDSIPEWMYNSEVISSDMVYGEVKTIGEIFGREEGEYTRTTKKIVNDNLVIINELVSEGVLYARLTTTFVLARIGDAGRCYISSVVFEIPLEFKTLRYSCNGPSPLLEYAEVLGAFWGACSYFYK